MKNKMFKSVCGLIGLALSTTAFGQQPQDVTDKLENPSFEYGTSNWQVDILPDANGKATMWGKTDKDQTYAPRFFGFHGNALQVWLPTSSTNPVFVGNNGFSQTLTSLPNGTYVFGAYAVAADQAATIPNLENIEGRSGVNIFANENMIPVATENPEADTLHTLVHARKFNVATNVQDGTLKVGVTTEDASVNFLAIDECTLFFFGDMNEEDALVAMAKEDLKATLNIADTCLNGKWVANKDSLELLRASYDEAKPYAAATMETSEYELEEKWVDLRNRILLANKSIADYRGVNDALTDADTLLAYEADWMSIAKEEGAIGKLNDSITLCRNLMDEHTSGRDELVTHRNGLREAMAAVRVYELMNNVETVLQTFLDTAGFSVDKDEAGKYSLNQRKQLLNLQEDIQMSYDAYLGEEMTARDLIKYTPKIQEAIDQIIAMGKLEYNSFPIVLNGKKDGFPYNVGDRLSESKQIEWSSKLYMFNSDVKKLHFSVKGTNANDSNNNHHCWALAELTIYDKNGKEYDINPSNYEALVTANAPEPTEGPLVNLFDGETGNFFHTQWSGNGPDEDHYVEVTLPEGDYDYTGFSFTFVTRPGGTWLMPVHIEITTTTSQAMKDLISAVDDAPLVYQGTEPGYFAEDMGEYKGALKKAKELIADGGTETELNEARVTLEKTAKAFDGSRVNLPVEGKEYRLISSQTSFFENQNVEMAMVAHQDTCVWWETAAPDSTKQLFTFERIPNDTMFLYRIKNVHAQAYMVYSENNKVLLKKNPAKTECDTVLMELVGKNQFAFYFPNHKKEGAFHNGDHNNGMVEDKEGYYGAGSKAGVTSGICYWDGSIPDVGSSWYLRELSELPLTALVPAGKQSDNYHLAKGQTLITFSSKEASALNGLQLYDIFGDTIPCSLVQVGNTVTAVMESPIASFALSLDNTSDVEVSVSNIAPPALELQDIYNEAVALAPVQGTHVFQYADLTAYNAALENAEKILEEGADDALTENAIQLIQDAVKGLVVNMPDPDKQYFILNGWDAFEKNHLTPVAMFENSQIGYPAWTFLQKNNAEFLWRFTEVKPAATDPEGTPSKYFIQNVTSGNYLTDGESVSGQSEPSSAYKLTQIQGDILAFDGDKGRIHGNEHGNGWGAFGPLTYWGTGLGTSSIWKICEAEAVITDIDFSEMTIENETAVKGVYDLFGRRVVAPTKGLYIIDGKKRVIK